MRKVIILSSVPMSFIHVNINSFYFVYVLSILWFHPPVRSILPLLFTVLLKKKATWRSLNKRLRSTEQDQRAWFHALMS